MNRAELKALHESYLQLFPEEASEQQTLADSIATDPQDMFSRKNMRGHITTSALVVNATEDSTLFIHHKALGLWLQPGGHYDPPGTLWESALREVQEETSVTATMHNWHKGGAIPFDIHTHPIPANPKKDEGDHFHHDFVYLVSAPADATLNPQLEEVHGVRWLPFAEMETLDGGRLRERFLPKLKRIGLL